MSSNEVRETYFRYLLSLESQEAMLTTEYLLDDLPIKLNFS